MSASPIRLGLVEMRRATSKRAEYTHCRFCPSTAITRIGEQWRCNQCGGQWGNVEIGELPKRYEALERIQGRK